MSFDSAPLPPAPTTSGTFKSCEALSLPQTYQTMRSTSRWERHYHHHSGSVLFLSCLLAVKRGPTFHYLNRDLDHKVIHYWFYFAKHNRKENYKMLTVFYAHLTFNRNVLRNSYNEQRTKNSKKMMKILRYLE